MSDTIDLSTMKIPVHVAVIMDGNGRWAQKRGEERTYGHAVGSEVVEQMVEIASDLGIRFFTVYAFSTENWKRSEKEVTVLFELFSIYLQRLMEKSTKNNVRCFVIGSRDGLSEDLLNVIDELEEKTKYNTGLTFNIAINYGGRDEITRAVRSIASDVASGRIAPEDITESTISERLDTSGMPDPDLMIRTGGEERISNFLPWQLAYTEFYFTDVCWPDFNRNELVKAIAYFNGRDRRFGGVK
ncbi:MAG: isoprenyl transferase [Clostridiales bacterium]|nr:isoprenyl transferase [Clostridiales bacterium]MDU1042571.1 isoprenyl transferase [Clostridiales bacterium]